MAFDLDDEELEATRVFINHLPPKEKQDSSVDKDNKDVKLNDKQ